MKIEEENIQNFDPKVEVKSNIDVDVDVENQEFSEYTDSQKQEI